jgi:threonine dehydratase
MDYLKKILQARVYDVAIESPLEAAPKLSAATKNRVFLKREDLQPIFSFKLRGAYNKMATMPERARRRGVIAASAGNHAQGVALAAKRLGCRATIVMPLTTPDIKVKAVRGLGATVVLHGDAYADAYEKARALARASRRAFVHPYDDPAVIAGQGTIGMEIVNQSPDAPAAIFVPVGGGGLIAGIAAYVKRVRPSTKVIGVEPVDADALKRSLAAGRRVELAQVGTFADGVAVKSVGKETFRLCKTLVDDVVLVDTDDVCAAIKDVFEDTRTVLEPSGALAVAGLHKYAAAKGWRRKRLVAVTSGANMNFDRLRFVAERAELGEQREALFAVGIPERPGSFKAFCQLIGPSNVTEFNYRYADPRVAHVFVGLQVHDRRHAARLLKQFRRAGLSAQDLTGNELAKLHVRHLVGGHAMGLRDEVLYRFEFPERPGALMRFLNAMGGTWNISLFHYRNQGSDYGRVLAGIQVPEKDRAAFRRFLKKMGYPFVDETRNPAFRIFLA